MMTPSRERAYTTHGADEDVYNIFVEKPVGKRLLRRPR
jgi:hypothetical protein